MKFTIPLVLLIALLSCKKLTEVSPKDGLITGDYVFSSPNSANEAIIGIYTEIMREVGLANGFTTKSAALYADELYRFIVHDLDSGFLNSNLFPGHRVLIAPWKTSYKYIRACNIAIAKLDRSTLLDDVVKAQFAGEAKFIRAFFYFYLVNLYGDVPLITGADYAVNATLPGSQAADIYSQIMSDLNSAIQLLPESYGSGDKRIRASKWAANSLLARVYLYNKRWQEAEQAATATINCGLFSMNEPLASAFLTSSQETILQLQPVNGEGSTTEASYFLTFINGRPAYEATGALINSFEPGDNRKTEWLKPVVSGNSIYYSINKYKTYKGALGQEYNILLRLAEQYLIRAEARARQNNLAHAIDDLNIVRRRAKLADLPATLQQSEILACVARERRTEFFVELGHRYLDLRRWYNSDTPMDTLHVIAAKALSAKQNWQPFKNTWPIPESEIKANSNLSQNSGYR